VYLRGVQGGGLADYQLAAYPVAPAVTLVIGVHAGFIDTEMAAAVEHEKIPPEDVAAATMRAILEGREEVLGGRAHTLGEVDAPPRP
jgi:hypothetical protein